MRTLAAVLLCIVLVAGAWPAEGEGPWTLASAIEQARSASPEARIAEARVAAAQAAVAEAESARLPSLDLRASYMQTTNPMQAFGSILSHGVFDDTLDFNNPGQIDAFVAGLHAHYVLYAGGRIRAGREAAAASAEAAAFDLEAALARLDLEVARAYYAGRMYEATVTAVEASLRSYDESLQLASAREESGSLLPTERLGLQAQRAQVSQQLLAARHGGELAGRRLAFLMGLSATTSPRLAKEDAEAARMQPPPDDSFKPRPEVLAARSREAAGLRQVDAARGARLPSVGAFASAQEDRGWRRDGSGSSWTAGVAVELPLFDGARLKSKAAAAKAEALIASESIRQVELALSLERAEAELDHELSLAQLEVAAEQVAAAEASAQFSRERFAAGALLSTELIAAETRLADARMAQAHAMAQERVAVAALRRVAGWKLAE